LQFAAVEGLVVFAVAEVAAGGYVDRVADRADGAIVKGGVEAAGVRAAVADGAGIAWLILVGRVGGERPAVVVVVVAAVGIADPIVAPAAGREEAVGLFVVERAQGHLLQVIYAHGIRLPQNTAGKPALRLSHI